MRRYEQRRRARGAARTAAAIDAAVLRELARVGFPALRIARVAERAGVSPRTVYSHAPTKERLAHDALRTRAAQLLARVEAWRARSTSAEGMVSELVAYHEREYRAEKALLETLVDGALPRSGAQILRELDLVRLAAISRTMEPLARRGALRLRAVDATAVAHALLSYPTWRVALTGPARHRAPKLVADALRAAVLA